MSWTASAFITLLSIVAFIGLTKPSKRPRPYTEETLDAPSKARIAAETATGIAYLHMRDISIVHGDMKAGNVLLTRWGGEG